MINFAFLLKKKKKNKGESTFILTSENYNIGTKHCLYLLFGFLNFLIFNKQSKIQSSNNS